MQKNRGIIQTAIIFVLIIIILSLIGIKLADIFKNETLKENFAFASKGLVYVWSEWLKEPALAVWSWIRDLMWSPASEVIKNAGGRMGDMFGK